MVQEPSRDPGRETVQGTWEGESVEYFANRVIVKFKAGREDASGISSIAADLVAEVDEAAAIVRPPGPTRRALVAVTAEADVAEVAAKLSARPDVLYAEPDIVDHAAVTPNDTRLAEQWSLPMVDAFDAWDLETGDPTVLIGVIDSGISMTGGALDHPDLSGSRFTLGTDFVDGGEPRDLNGHGTHVAGIAAGLGNNAAGVAGMAWGTRVYICRTLDAAGSGSSADFADAVEEIVDFALANNLKAVINYSGGGGANQTKLDACNYASTNGMLLCAATGNDDHGPVIWPAAYSLTVPGVVAVGSTDQADQVSTFSNVGPEVTVVAPGTGILSAMPTYAVTINAGLNFGTLDGTSMATPLVTGLAALMWSRHIGFTNQKIKDCLISSAVKLGAGSFDNAWGNGRVSAEAALRCGDVVVLPSLVGPGCTPSRIIVQCPSRIVAQCPTRIPVRCPSRIIVQCPSLVPETCPTQVPALCPSRAPVLCPVSRVPAECPSRLPVLCPTTLVPATCGRVSQIPALCPTPSAIPATCPIPIPDLPIPDPGPLRPAGEGSEQWYGEGEWYVLDDAGEARAFPGPDAAAASPESAEWYWLDDQGGTHYWSGG
jgi:subtilisin family serine protease